MPFPYQVRTKSVPSPIKVYHNRAITGEITSMDSRKLEETVIKIFVLFFQTLIFWLYDFLCGNYGNP